MPPEGRIAGLADYLNRKAKEAAEQARKTLFGAVISAGGLLIRDDGAFEIVTSAGVYVLYAKRGIDGKREFGLLRDNGTLVLRTFSTAGGQAWALHDNSNNVVFSDDGVTGQGVAKPWLPSTASRARYQSWEATTSATFESLWRVVHHKTHPKVFGLIRHTTDVAGTTGEWQLVLDGTGAVLASGSVGFVQTGSYIGPLAVPGGFDEALDLSIQARRTAGTGSVRVEFQFVKGVGS